MESARIMPKPDDAEREAILAALAAEAAGQPRTSRWAETLLPARDAQEGEA